MDRQVVGDDTAEGRDAGDFHFYGWIRWEDVGNVELVDRSDVRTQNFQCQAEMGDAFFGLIDRQSFYVDLASVKDIQ